MYPNHGFLDHVPGFKFSVEWFKWGIYVRGDRVKLWFWGAVHNPDTTKGLQLEAWSQFPGPSFLQHPLCLLNLFMEITFVCHELVQRPPEVLVEDSLPGNLGEHHGPPLLCLCTVGGGMSVTRAGGWKQQPPASECCAVMFQKSYFSEHQTTTEPLVGTFTRRFANYRQRSPIWTMLPG